MILIQMIEHTTRRFWGVVLRRLTTLAIVLLVSACGGGLGGSGDGGEGGGTSSIILLPDTFAPSYQFRHVPERMIAQFPSSLSNDEIVVDPTAPSPYAKLTATVDDLIDSKLEIGLLQLHLESNWTAITEHCETTSEDSECILANAGIASTYTPAMASWEFILRAELALERSGDINTPTEDERTEIARIVTARIGSELPVNSGNFTTRSSGSYRYEIVTIADLGFGETIYTTRWSEDKSLTFVSISEIDANNIDSLQSSTNNKIVANGFSNAILMTTYENDSRQERQLNLNQLPNTSDLRVESHITEILASTRNDYYSIGSASATGGYISSEQSTEDEEDRKVSDFFRETFTKHGQVDSQSICREGQSQRQCDNKERWEVVTSLDPVTSQFFLTPMQLDEVEERLAPFELDIQGVSLELDTLLLIRRENLTISLSSAGIIITVPGLGTFDLTNNALVPDADADPEDQELLSKYADSLLCRINTALVDNETEYRSFCAGTIEDIENALVIGESFREGELVIEWQANASVSVIEN